MGDFIEIEELVLGGFDEPYNSSANLCVMWEGLR